MDKECEQLCFENISTKTNKGKPILYNLNGSFPSGSLIAIIGPSGAGKTTLLNVLSGYKIQNTTCDALKINGIPTNFEEMSEISCYLTQDIHLNDLLTVEENMSFTADFKFGALHTKKDKHSIIEELIESFGLSPSRHTRAGNLSGGERKRLAIALEMIRDPKIICLDEPTTGLDISSTNHILNFLKKIAKRGKTVICTIHQVSASHFELFDYAYVITNGQCAYEGRPQELVTFLDKVGLPCNIFHNPADYVIELCSGDYGEEKGKILVEATERHYKCVQQKQESMDTGSRKDVRSDISNTSWRYQYKTLVNREYIKLRRNILMVPMRLIGCNLISLFYGLIFWNIGNDATMVIANYKFSLGICANILLTGLMCPVLTFPKQIQLVKREVFNKYYTVFQYYSSIMILDMPVLITAVSSSSMFVWYITGQPLEMERILVFQFIMVTFGILVNSIGFFFGTVDISLNASLLMSTMTHLPMLVLSGFGLFFQDMHWLFEYIGRITYLRNAMQGCLVSMFGLKHRKMECPVEFCIYKEPHRLLLQIGVDPYHYFSYGVNLMFWLIFIILVTYFSMKFRLTR